LTDWITLHTIGASGIGIFKPNSAGMELNLLGEVAVNEEKNDEGTQGGKEKVLSVFILLLFKLMLTYYCSSSSRNQFYYLHAITT
jgi:hypothetical protein